MKAKDDVLDLRASIARLSALDGAVVHLKEGVFLADVAGLARQSETRGHRRARDLGPDPRPLVEAAQRGVPSLATWNASVSCAHPPSRVDARLLATLRRDVRRVSSKAAQAEIAREPRAFRKFGAIDERFLAARAEKLERLAGVRDDSPSPGLEGVLALVAAVRGAAAAERARAIVVATKERARAAHPLAIARLSALRALPEDDELSEGLRALSRLPGRARARRIARLLASAVSRPAPVVPANRSFEEQLAFAIDALVASFGDALPHDFDARIERVVGAYALLVTGAERPSEDAIAIEDLVAAEQRLASLALVLDGRALDPAEALALAVPSISPPQTRKLAGWIEEGLALSEVRATIAAGALDSLLSVEGDARVASTWAAWATRLLPHFKALGLAVKLDPAVLRGVRASHEELAVLAQCLVEQEADGDPAAVERQLAALDATLALFGRAPLRVRDAIRAVRTVASGEGRARFPSFAAFVDDDARLDRYLHLARLAGEPAVPSAALLEDAELLDELGKQLAHLESIAEPTEVQRARIVTLRASIAAGPKSPERTRRRLDARIRSLLPRSYRVVLDRILGEVLREAWGIAPRATTPAWRDAVRFFLTIEDNREHLRTLLRHASTSPGTPIERTLPKNRAYLEAMRDKVDVDAFLAPRKTEIAIDDKRYVIALEEDPIEVLRMGIPFDTCLSLTDGCNAASTVLNAIDANKRVIYVRDAGGAIVARKLVALSEDGRLLGYRLYCAAPEIASVLEDAVDTFCRAFAVACRIGLADGGEPRKLHDGFWYDDGAVAWPARQPGDEVARYCASLGVSAPAVAPTRLCEEARRFAARESGDVERMMRVLPGWIESPGDAAVGDAIVEALGVERAAVRARRNDDLCPAIARAISRGSLADMASRATRIGAAEQRELNETVAASVARFDDEPAAVRGLVSLARAAVRAGHVRGLAHATFDLDRHLAKASVGAFLAEADRIEKVFAHVVAEDPRCAACREGAIASLARAMEVAYARAPDPDAVLATLRSPRAGDLARSLALRAASRFPLDVDAPFGPFSALSRGVGRAPTVVSALTRLHRSERAFAGDPELIAAIVRQGGRGRSVPMPRSSPFEAFADLALDPANDLFFAPFLAPEPEAFAPGRFELHVHRRVDGPFRRTLRRRALDGDAAAASWLALMGDVAAVERAPAGKGGKVPAHHRLAIARAIVAARKNGGLDLSARVVGTGDLWPAEVIDPVVVRNALAIVAAAAATPAAPSLDAAVGTLQAAVDSAWPDAVLAIANIPEGWARERVRAFVNARVSTANRTVDGVAWRETLLLSRGHESLVVEALAREIPNPFDVAADRALRTWTSLDREGGQALFRRWLAAYVVHRDPSDVLSTEDPARRDLLVDVLASGTPDRLRAAIVAIDDYETLSKLLRAATISRGGPEMLAGGESTGKFAVLRSWLDASPALTHEATP